VAGWVLRLPLTALAATIVLALTAALLAAASPPAPPPAASPPEPFAPNVPPCDTLYRHGRTRRVPGRLMPNYMELQGRLFEVTVLAEADGDALAPIELFELGADGGEIGTISAWSNRPLEAQLHERNDVPVPILDWWFRIALQEQPQPAAAGASGA
jgi:hypothetical protein